MEVEQKKKVEENQKQKQKQVDENEFVKVTDFEEIFDNLKTERNGDAFVADRLREVSERDYYATFRQLTNTQSNFPGAQQAKGKYYRPNHLLQPPHLISR